jgi:hypothetical protein
MDTATKKPTVKQSYIDTHLGGTPERRGEEWARQRGYHYWREGVGGSGTYPNVQLEDDAGRVLTLNGRSGRPTRFAAFHEHRLTPRYPVRQSV